MLHSKNFERLFNWRFYFRIFKEVLGGHILEALPGL